MPTVTTYPGVFGPYTPITFTRASGATYFDSAGVLTSAAIDAPRLDYNPSTLAAQGLLIEEQRVNIVPSSVYTANANGWTNGVIGGTGTIAAAAVNSPSGTTAGVFNISGLNGSSYVGQFSTVTASANARTGSVFVRNNGGVKFQIRLVFQTGGTFASYGTEYDFNTTAFQDGIAGTAVPTSRSVTNIGNGWLRISITASDNGTGNTQASLQFWGTATTTNYNYFMWGTQIEEGASGASAAFPTSYIPTTVAQVTRNADVASVNTLSPWFNSASGTLYAEAQYPFVAASGLNSGFAEIDDGTFNEAIANYVTSGGNSTFVVRDNSATQAGVTVSGMTANTVIKIAGAYAVNDFQQATNGTLGVADTSGSLPTVTRLALGDIAVGQKLNGWLRRVSYYPTRLSNAQLQAITA